MRGKKAGLFCKKEPKNFCKLARTPGHLEDQMDKSFLVLFCKKELLPSP
jgi:hypothetical protein